MKMKMRLLAIGVSLLALSLGGLSVVLAANSERCAPMDCGYEPSCTYFDRTWPNENACLNTVIDNGDECKWELQGGWTCTDPRSDRLCAKQYWNYIGQWGGPGECNYGPTGGCGEEEFASQYGLTVPDSCTETFTSP